MEHPVEDGLAVLVDHHSSMGFGEASEVVAHGPLGLLPQWSAFEFTPRARWQRFVLLILVDDVRGALLGHSMPSCGLRLGGLDAAPHRGAEQMIYMRQKQRAETKPGTKLHEIQLLNIAHKLSFCVVYVLCKACLPGVRGGQWPHCCVRVLLEFFLCMAGAIQTLKHSVRAWWVFDIFPGVPQEGAGPEDRLCCCCLLPSVAEVVLFQAVKEVVSVTPLSYDFTTCLAHSTFHHPLWNHDWQQEQTHNAEESKKPTTRNRAENVVKIWAFGGWLLGKDSMCLEHSHPDLKAGGSTVSS